MLHTRCFIAGLAISVLFASGPAFTAEVKTMMTFDDIIRQEPPPAGIRIEYDSTSPLQFGELRLPEGAGPHPLVVLVHGGCWRNAYDYRHITPAAAALTRAGFATWTIEFR